MVLLSVKAFLGGPACLQAGYERNYWSRYIHYLILQAGFFF